MKKLLSAVAALCLIAMPGLAFAQQAVAYQDDTVAPILNVPVTSSKPLPTTCVSGCSGGATAVTTTDKSGTITLGGTAQAGIALNASRKSWCIQNPDTATTQGIGTAEVLWVRVGGTAAANVGTELTPGNQACSAPGLIDTAAISVFAATTGHKFNGFEAQ